MSSPEDRAARRAAAEARTRGLHHAVPVATPTIAPAVGRTDLTPGRTEGIEGAPASVHLSAAEVQNGANVDAAARAMGVTRDQVFSRGGKWAYWIGQSVQNAITGVAAGTGTKLGLTALGLTATAPAYVPVLAAGAAGFASVMILRWATKQRMTDKMAKAGSVATKIRKQTKKAEKAARKAGGSYSITREGLDARAGELANKVEWAAMPVRMGVGFVTGNIGYELHQYGGWGKGPVTSTINDIASRVYEGAPSRSWWVNLRDTIWNVLCGKSSVQTPVAAAPVHEAACAEHIRPWKDRLEQYAITHDELKQQNTFLQSTLSTLEADKTLLLQRVEELKQQLIRATPGSAEVDALKRDIDTLNAYIRDELSASGRRTPEADVTPGPEPRRVVPREGTEIRIVPVPDAAIPETVGTITVPIEGARDIIARTGLEGLLEKTIFKQGDPPIEVKLQIIDAVRRTFLDNPEYVARLGRVSVKAGDLVFQNSGMIDASVMGERRFLLDLKATIEAHETTHLVPWARRFGGVDGLIFEWSKYVRTLATKA